MKMLIAKFVLIGSLICAAAAQAQVEDVRFGNLHAHSSYSDGLGTPGEAYTMACEAGLDFFAVTEHNHAAGDGKGERRDGLMIATQPALYNLYLDFVTWKSVVEVAGLDSDAYPEYLERLSSLIETGLNHVDVRVVEKYLWLHRAYAAEHERFATMAARYVQDRDYVDAIKALPNFSALAAKARKRTEAARK